MIEPKIVFVGRRSGTKAVVEVIDGRKDAKRVQKLPMRLDLSRHSPTGFEWGYSGSGPAQLALAILAYSLDDDERALKLHHDYKRRVVTRLQGDRGWHLSKDDVLRIVAELETLRVPNE